MSGVNNRLSKEEWIVIAKQILEVEAAHQRLLSTISGHVTVKTLDKGLLVSRKISVLKSMLEDEMYRHGVPFDPRIFYPGAGSKARKK